MSLLRYGGDLGGWCRTTGSGLYDPCDLPVLGAVLGEEAVAFDEAYISPRSTVLGRRGEDFRRRLISSDADYLPGFVVEQFEDLIASADGPMEAQQGLVAEILKECYAPQEIALSIRSAGAEPIVEII